MENQNVLFPIPKIKMFLSRSLFACIVLALKSTPAINNNNNNKREGRVIISSRQTSDIITITLSQLQQLLDKFERSQFDGVFVMGECTTSTEISFHQLKLFMYECGEIFSLQYRNHHVKIDRDIIHKLFYIEEKLKSFIEFETDNHNDDAHAVAVPTQ